jgi:hypothetical protein
MTCILLSIALALGLPKNAACNGGLMDNCAAECNGGWM